MISIIALIPNPPASCWMLIDAPAASAIPSYCPPSTSAARAGRDAASTKAAAATVAARINGRRQVRSSNIHPSAYNPTTATPVRKLPCRFAHSANSRGTATHGIQARHFLSNQEVFERLGEASADANLTTVHAANICMWLKRDMKFDPAREEFVGDDEANRLRSRAMREPWII